MLRPRKARKKKQKNEQLWRKTGFSARNSYQEFLLLSPVKGKLCGQNPGVGQHAGMASCVHHSPQSPRQNATGAPRSPPPKAGASHCVTVFHKWWFSNWIPFGHLGRTWCD